MSVVFVPQFCHSTVTQRETCVHAIKKCSFTANVELVVDDSVCWRVCRRRQVNCRKLTRVWRGLSRLWSVMRASCSTSPSHWCATSPCSIDVQTPMYLRQHRQTEKNLHPHVTARSVPVLCFCWWQKHYVFGLSIRLSVHLSVKTFFGMQLLFI